MSATVNDQVHLPAGPIVRIRARRPADGPASEHLSGSHEAVRLGRPIGEEEPALVVDFPWGGRIIGHAAWGRLSGPRAAVSMTVARSFSRWPVASHLLVRLARLADAELVPTLVVSGTGGDVELEHLLTAGFGAELQPDGGAEIATREWPAALATLEHRSDAFVETDRAQPAGAGGTAAAADRAQPAVAPGTADAADPTRPVVIVGGGVAALECLMALRDAAGPELPVRLVAPDDAFVYRPLQVAEPFSLGTARRHPLSRIAADFGTELVKEAIIEVRAEERRAVCASGATLDYAALVLALGARPMPAFEHAITFGQDPGHGALHGLLADLEQGYAKHVAFVVPPGTSWSLPLYEVALMTAREVAAQGIDDAHFSFVTPEQRPLAIFGPRVGDAVRGLLAAAGVAFIGGGYATVGRGSIRIDPGGRTFEVDRAVALPALRGPAIRGLPADEAGFIPTDGFGAVAGLEDVYAAGDATTFPVKQGGLAAQQADVVAQAVAARFGAALTPRPFKPVLRGLLFTGGEDRFLRAGIGGGEGDATTASTALWWPPTKVAGLYLAPYLYDHDPGDAPVPAGFTRIEAPLEPA